MNKAVVLSFASFAKEYSERNVGQRHSEVRSVTNAGVLIPTSDYFENARTSADTSNYKVVRPGMFAYNPSRINVGSIAVNRDNAPVIVSPMYVVFECDETQVAPEYLALYLSSSRGIHEVESRTEIGARFRLPFSSLSTIQMPVPSLQRQLEIVRILGHFTELQAELEAELEARLAQFTYYREKLLDSPKVNAETRSLAELVSSVSSGRNKSRSDSGPVPVYGSTGLIGFGNTANYLGPSLLVARVGANAGRVYAVDGEYDVSDNTLVLSPNEDWSFRFAFHQLTNANLNQHAKGGGQPLITGGQLKALMLAVPTFSEQMRIAESLDWFNALIHDSSMGLPAELAARRKQYEYYRDKLLTFEEAPA